MRIIAYKNQQLSQFIENHQLYNIMLNKHLITSCILASLILVVHSYHLRMGSTSIIPDNLDLSPSNNSQTLKVICQKRMFIFPYDIYEYATPGSNTPLAKSFIFLRLNYDQIQDNTTDDQMEELDEIPESQQLFEKLPQVILIDGNPNEYLQILRHDQSLMNRNFIIKNSTLQNYKSADPQYTLNFYSLQVHKYFYTVVRIAKKQLHKHSKIQEKQEQLTSDNITKLSKIQLSMDEKKMFILNNILSIDETFTYSDIINQLVHLVMKRQIGQNTKWSVRYNSFGTIYGSASLVQEEGDYQQFLDLEIVVLLSREGNAKRVQHIKQPLKSLKLTSVSHLQICFQQENYKLLLSDSNSFYLIDFTERLLHLDQYKTFTEQLKNIFMVGSDCRVVTLQEIETNTVLTEWKNYLSKKKIQKNGQIFGSYPICNQYFAICWSAKQCNLFDYKLNQIAVLNVNLSEQNLEWYLRIKVDELDINTEIEVVGSNRQISFTRVIKQQPIFVANKLNNSEASIENSTIFWNFVYSLDVYMNKSEFKNAEMDRVMWDHLQWLRQGNEFPSVSSTYKQFTTQIQENAVNCYTSLKKHSQILFTRENISDWSICSIEAQTQSSSELTLFFNSTVSNYDLYNCEAQIQSISGDIAAECELLIKYSDPLDFNIQIYRLQSNRYFKFYLIRRQFIDEAVLPTILFTDIEKSEIQYASSLAVIIIATLIICLFIIVAFVVMKPLIASILIYNGWMQQRDDFPYPLSWFNLKIKLKKLTDYGYLKYIIHNNKDEQDQTHCCFCLQTIRTGKMAAQLFCMHQFHKECFNQWIKNEPNPRCPTCRRQFTRSNFLDFQNSQQQIGIDNL